MPLPHPPPFSLSGHLCVRPQANPGLHLSLPPRCTYVCVCVCVCMCVCVCVCVCICICMCVCVCVCIDTHTHTYTYVCISLDICCISRSPFLLLARSLSRSLAVPHSLRLSLSLSHSPPRPWLVSVLSADACNVQINGLSLRLSRVNSWHFGQSVSGVWTCVCEFASQTRTRIHTYTHIHTHTHTHMV